MKQNLVWMAALGAALSLAPPAAAQDADEVPLNGGLQVAVLHAGNVLHEGWGQSRAFTNVAVRATLPVSGRWNVWAGVARDNTAAFACTDGQSPGESPFDDTRTCEPSGVTPTLLHGGVGFRFRPTETLRTRALGRDLDLGRLTPFAGAGIATTDNVRQGGRRVLPHLHGGVDWSLSRALALRWEAQSELELPGRIAVGAVVTLP